MISMRFWERVNKDLRLAMKEGVDLLKEGTSTLTTEARRLTKKGAASMKAGARRMTRLGKLRYEVYRLNRKAHSKFADMGGQVYDLTSKDLTKFKMDEQLKKLILETRQIEERIKTLESEIRRLVKSKQKRAA